MFKGTDLDAMEAALQDQVAGLREAVVPADKPAPASMNDGPVEKSGGRSFRENRSGRGQNSNQPGFSNHGALEKGVWKIANSASAP
jgi:hypothetical protein